MLAASGGQLGADQIAVCACVYDQNPLSQDPGAFAAQTIWEHRGTAQIYPASLCKMFYLVALAAFQDAGRIVLDDEDHRAVRAMIGLSSNDATTYLLGRLTGAFDGPMMAPSALQSWLDARQQVQDWLNGLGIPGLAGINLLHSTYEDSPYGRAKQARLARPGNTLSARAGAAMLHEMLRGALPGRDWMAGHMSRDWQRGGAPDPAHDPDGDQVLGFLSAGIPADFRVWSKAGHTSATRHDIACLSAPDGRTAIVSVMTEGRWTSRDQGALPAFARAFVENAFA
ncbi:MAG TPA: serine hydrolase [Paenirhodobacter sp.]